MAYDDLEQEVRLAEGIAAYYIERQELLAQLHAAEQERNRLRAELEQARAGAAVYRRALEVARRDASNSYIRHLCSGILKRTDGGAAFLAELAAARTVIAEIYDVADAPGEDIRATIDAYLEKEHGDE